MSKQAEQAKNLSVAQIAEMTDTSQKTIRAYLRREHSRSVELKNAHWGDAKKGYALSAALTKELVERYSKNDESDSE